MYKIHYLLKPNYGIDISCGRSVPPYETNEFTANIYKKAKIFGV
jgi:hypothetical protein